MPKPTTKPALTRPQALEKVTRILRQLPAVEDRRRVLATLQTMLELYEEAGS